MSAQQVAERFGVSQSTVLRLARSGALRALRVGRRWTFAESDVELYEGAYSQPMLAEIVWPKAALPAAPARGLIPWPPEILAITAPRAAERGKKKARAGR